MNAPNFFEIQADNVSQAKNFYEKVFGWKFIKIERLPIEYWLIETEGSQGGLLQRPAAVPPSQSGTNAYVSSMQVENFDATSETILNIGGELALPKFAVPGKCWQGYFIDPAGNTFGIFQVDPDAK